MQRDYKWLKITLSIIVIVVLVAYAFIAYIPHGHDFIDTDCVICNMVDSWKYILLSTVLLSTTQLHPRLKLILAFAHERIISLGESTPVGLKVKLSD